MDEPLSNLDAKLRVHMRTELAELHDRLGTTFIYVTHDQIEAMTMSDRVAMMDGGTHPPARQSRGAVRAAGERSRRAVHRHAGDQPAAGAGRRIGVRRALRLRAADSRARKRGLGADDRHPPGGDHPGGAGSSRPGLHVLPGRLRRSENLGAGHILHVDLAAPASGAIICTTTGDADPCTGDARGLALPLRARGLPRVRRRRPPPRRRRGGAMRRSRPLRCGAAL